MNSFGGPRTLPRGCGTQVLISLGLVLCPIYRYTLMQREARGPCSVDMPPESEPRSVVRYRQPVAVRPKGVSNNSHDAEASGTLTVPDCPRSVWGSQTSTCFIPS